MEKKPLLISACLLGLPCRYDGKSKPMPELQALMEHYILVPVCPETLGGLPTPRTRSERKDDRVIMYTGEDVTENYLRGAQGALQLARLSGCTMALLKERSPSCGKGQIYDGTFTRTLVPGSGVTAELLQKEGVQIFGETETQILLTSDGNL